VTITPNVNQQNEDGVKDFRPVASFRITVQGVEPTPPDPYRVVSDCGITASAICFTESATS